MTLLTFLADNGYVDGREELCEWDAMCARPAIAHAGHVPVCEVHAASAGVRWEADR